MTKVLFLEKVGEKKGWPVYVFVSEEPEFVHQNKGSGHQKRASGHQKIKFYDFEFGKLKEVDRYFVKDDNLANLLIRLAEGYSRQQYFAARGMVDKKVTQTIKGDLQYMAWPFCGWLVGSKDYFVEHPFFTRSEECMSQREMELREYVKNFLKEHNIITERRESGEAELERICREIFERNKGRAKDAGNNLKFALKKKPREYTKKGRWVMK